MTMIDPPPIIVEPEHTGPEMFSKRPTFTSIRVTAGLIDLAVLLIPFAVALAFGTRLAWLGFATVAVLYYSVTEVAMDGQTPGKRVAGLRVVASSGDRVSGRQVALRTLLRAIDILPVLYLVGVVFLLASRGERRLGDFVAGTKVVNAHGTGH
ncbi:MAG: RDD family protein [Dehalococcoidia bacterium]|nr:RDD family protein [Dehalococcoidia bacterium]